MTKNNKKKNPTKFNARKGQLRGLIYRHPDPDHHLRRPIRPITASMTEAETQRLRPLAWLIQREAYTITELLRCHLAHQEHLAETQEHERAQEILRQIRQRSRERGR